MPPLLPASFEFASDNTTSANTGFRPRLSTGLGSCFFLIFYVFARRYNSSAISSRWGCGDGYPLTTFWREGRHLLRLRQDEGVGTVTMFTVISRDNNRSGTPKNAPSLHCFTEPSFCCKAGMIFHEAIIIILWTNHHKCRPIEPIGIFPFSKFISGNPK